MVWTLRPKLRCGEAAGAFRAPHGEDRLGPVLQPNFASMPEPYPVRLSRSSSVRSCIVWRIACVCLCPAGATFLVCQDHAWFVARRQYVSVPESPGGRFRLFGTAYRVCQHHAWFEVHRQVLFDPATSDEARRPCGAVRRNFSSMPRSCPVRFPASIVFSVSHRPIGRSGIIRRAAPRSTARPAPCPKNLPAQPARRDPDSGGRSASV